MAGHSKKHMRTRYNPYMSKASRKKKLMMRLIVVVGRWDLSEGSGAARNPRIQTEIGSRASALGARRNRCMACMGGK